MKRKFYGFRYFGDKSTTWAHSPRHVAGELKIFLTNKERNKWLSEENFYRSDKGKREIVSRKQAINMIGKESFEREIEMFEIGLKCEQSNDC